MEIRNDLKYTEQHEWIDIDGSTATLGITDFAQDSLGDVVYVELPELGTIVHAGDVVGNIESVKAVSEIYGPISGEVIEINKEIEEKPELVNTSPYDLGWMIKLKIDKSEISAMDTLTSEEYQELISK